ncbi:LytR/AlgR family response regulator transcription factor [Mongoliitalea daihaiensis]|uniref:LytR/AlgR family response regulator transcription factor n=1 Tax=Mongoliitalea daihaiensis TaxID=2782006 RepID=UPI001F1D065B|nr:response regulator transcription factor [Mongoliitalea daihaiensis]UJP63914.1 response regulator transcription factor [Mongoliitalea daihaiensis]
MLKAIAIDDEVLALEVIKSHASKTPTLDLQHTFTNPLEGLEYLRAHPIDVLFLDIKMPDLNGLELKVLLPKDLLVIFTTAYSEHAVKGFELDALDYLLKPFSLSRFLKACDKAMEIYSLKNPNKSNPEYVFIKSGNEEVRVIFSELLYCEARGNYVHFELSSGGFLSRMTFKEAEALLPSDFVKSHRSFVVNTTHVGKVEKQQVLVQGKIVPIGSNFQESFLAALKR